MDSPTEFSAYTLRTFTRAGRRRRRRAPTFRIALHHDGTDADADAFARDTERIVRESVAIFGEFPRYENNTYTFLSDYLPWASGDGMEHRNSTVLSGSGALRDPGQRTGMLGTVAHEFFHAWNMERIRAARPRAVQLRGGQRLRRAVARRRLHQLLRRPDHAARGARRRSSRRWAALPAPSTPSTLSPGAAAFARRRR